MNCRNTLYLLLAGVWFAELQVSSLFLLQTYFTASIQAYLLMVTAWLAGAVLGVWITLRLGTFLWCSSALASLGLLQIWASQLPLPVELSWVLLFVTALPAGQLFQEQLPSWPNVGRMFFLESIGFIMGLVLSTFLLMKFGLNFCRAVPAQGFVLAVFSLLLAKGAAKP